MRPATYNQKNGIGSMPSGVIEPCFVGDKIGARFLVLSAKEKPCGRAGLRRPALGEPCKGPAPIPVQQGHADFEAIDIRAAVDALKKPACLSGTRGPSFVFHRCPVRAAPVCDDPGSSAKENGMS
jgi:hypothetical protein